MGKKIWFCSACRKKFNSKQNEYNHRVRGKCLKTVSAARDDGNLADSQYSSGPSEEEKKN